MEFNYQHINSAVRESLWHLVWCTKYRYKAFRKLHYKNLADACIRKSASMHGIEIIELRVMPEHVHLIIRLPTRLSIEEALQILKGGSAYRFFKNAPKMRLRYPRGHLWSKGKFYTTIGYSDYPTTLNYVINQEQHHALAGN
jgi:putative transposase